MKKIFILLIFLIFFYCCQVNQTNLSVAEDIASMNYQKMITLIEYEDKQDTKTIYIDGNVNSIYPLTTVSLICYTKNGKYLDRKEGTYNAENFSFNLNLKKGNYLITIEATDIYGNKYVQKNVSLSVK